MQDPAKLPSILHKLTVINVCDSMVKGRSGVFVHATLTLKPRVGGTLTEPYQSLPTAILFQNSLGQIPILSIDSPIHPFK